MSEYLQKSYDRAIRDLCNAEARIKKLEEQLRWKSMTEEFPSEPNHLEVVYENAHGHRWCEVHKVSKPQGDMLGLAKPVLWRELTPLPKGGGEK